MCLRPKTALVAAIVILVLAINLPVSGQTWDPASDWSIANGNPNGVWSYGWLDKLGGTFTLDAESRPGDVEVWVGPSPNDAGLLMNTTTNPIADSYFASRQAALHPGESGALAVFRWTAPQTMYIGINATYTGNAPGGTTTDVHILHNSASVFDQVIDGFAGRYENAYFDAFGSSPSVAYSGYVLVQSGDAIDFAVGYGPNGNHISDLTGIVASITSATDVGAVQGFVKADETGYPVIAGATVKTADGVYSTTTKDDGSYVLYLPAGSYTLEASKEHYLAQQQSVDISSDGTTPQDFLLSTGMVKGTVKSSASGNPPIPGATLRFDGPNGSQSVVTGADGTYSISLPPADYYIQVSFAGHEQAGEYITLNGGQELTKDFILNLLTVDSWSANADFTTGSNPNNVWSYGYLMALDGDFSFYTDPFSTGTGLDGWVIGNPDNAGNIIKNVSSSPIEAGVYVWEANQLTPAPGPGGQLADVRWTSPVSGNVKITTEFRGQMTDNATTDVHVIKNGEPLYDGYVNGFGGRLSNNYSDASGVSPIQAYNGIVTVAIGDSIDFVIGSGGNGNMHDNTGLEAVVSLVSDTATIKGVVTANAAGNPPIAGAVVKTVEGSVSTTTASDGSYSMLVQPGTYTLDVSRTGFPTKQVSGVVVAAAGTVTQNVSLAAGTVVGKITANVAGNPAVNGASISDDESGLSAESGSDGTYSLVLGAGTHQLTVSARDFTTAKVADVVVPDGGSVTANVALEPGWDYALNFNTSDNPNGAWSYGYYDENGSFTAMTGTINLAGVPAWRNGPGSAILWKDVNSTSVSDGSFWLDPGKAALHPDPETGRKAVARWTAPYPGFIHIAAKFTGQTFNSSASPDGTTSDVSIIMNGASLFSADIRGFVGSEAQGYADTFGAMPVQEYADSFAVSAGDTVDFVVGPSDNGTSADTTGLDVIITPGSQPESCSISDLASKADGSLVMLSEPLTATVGSGSFADGTFYAENTDRTFGLKLVRTAGLAVVAPGDSAKFIGTVRVGADGVRYLEVGSLSDKVASDPIRPFGMNNKVLATNKPSVANLLVTTWGKVTSVAADSSYMMIDDGSGVAVKVLLSGSVDPSLQSAAKAGDYVSVTGIAVPVVSGSTVTSVIRACSAKDIVNSTDKQVVVHQADTADTYDHWSVRSYIDQGDGIWTLNASYANDGIHVPFVADEWYFRAACRLAQYDNYPLSKLTALKFAQFMQQMPAAMSGATFSVQIRTDINADTKGDELLTYDPYRSPGGASIAGAAGAWQVWDALKNGLWSCQSNDGTQQGLYDMTVTDPKPLSYYLEKQPNALLCESWVGAISVNAGIYDLDNWVGFQGILGNITIGTQDFGNIVYSFAP